MKNIRTSRQSIPATLAGIIPVILACSLVACVAFAADTPTPAPASAIPPPSPAISGSAGAAPRRITASLSASSEFENDVVGRVGNKDYKVKDIRAVLESLDPGEQAALASNPALLKAAVHSFLMDPIILKEINAKKWDQSPAVKAHLARQQQTLLVNYYLSTISTPPADYPSSAELQAAYEARKDSFMVPHQFQMSQIFIALPENADKDAAAKAQKKLQDVFTALNQPNADFAAIAKAQSDDAKSAAQGGNMGWVPDASMPDRLHLVALGLPKDAISQPIRLQDGFHIIKVTDAKDMAPLPLDQVKGVLVRQLRAERAKANLAAYVESLDKQNPITIDDTVLPELFSKPQNP